MLEKKEIEIEGKRFNIYKFDAWAGREIVTQYPLTGMPKLGEYKANAEIALKLMYFVEVITSNGDPIRLTNIDLINNHVPSWEAQLKIEWAVMEMNCSFFQNGKISTILSELTGKFPALITKMWTAFLASSSPKGKRR